MASTSDHRATVEFLLSRVEDAVRLCERRCCPQYLGFLDLNEQQTVVRYLRGQSGLRWILYGGYEDAERCFLGVFPSYMEPTEDGFPMRAVAFHYRPIKDINHRDVLGTLMGLGLRRDSVGDILCGVGYSVAFLKDDVAGFTREQVRKIGNEGVRVELDYVGTLPVAHILEPLTDTIAAPRLDAVIKALLHCSREQASLLIRRELVNVDHQPAYSVSCHVEEGSVVSIRGHGRFIIDRLGPETKKGRVHFEARKYV